MRETTKGLFDYIAVSPTGFQAVEEARRQLVEAGFSPLLEGEDWSLTPGQGYFVTRNQSSLIAFRMPQSLTGFMIASAHTDSPCFRIKEQPEVVSEGYTRLDADRYGGMIYSTWVDRPLSLAGRVMIRTDAGIETRLMDFRRDLAVIPSLAIHMDRTANDGKKFSPQTDLMALLGKGKRSLREMIAEELGLEQDSILSYDLYLYNRQMGTLLGPDGELILCPRLDDLQCTYGLLTGFLRADAPRAMPVLCLFDSEEIGSQTRQGAMSTFLKDTLRRAAMAAGLDEAGYLRCLSHSMMVSADNAHGVHPAHPEKAALTNRPKLGEGVVVKYGSGYSTTAVSAALLLRILGEAGVPAQNYFNHSDVAGGHTLGNLSMTQVPVCTVDIGLAQLAMHSACETAGEADTEYLCAAMDAFFRSAIRETAPGAYSIL